jgi:hypothetical protein
MTREHTHTRTIDYDAAPDGQGGLCIEAKLCDLRRLMFMTSIRGAPAKPGLIHDVELDLAVSDDRVVTESRFRMYSVPFADPTEHDGIVCRAIEPAFAALVGVAVDRGYTRSVVERIGGPRGCFHGLALAIGAGAVVEASMAVGAPGQATRGGERGRGVAPARFGRHLLIDGFAYGDAGVTMAGRLQDSISPVRAASAPLGRVVREVELEVSFEVGDFAYHNVSGALREEERGWDGSEVSALVSRLDGLVMGPGIFADARRRLAGQGGGEQILDLLSMMIPVTTQAAMRQLQKVGQPMPGVGGSMAQIDSCHMWAKGGPLESRVQALIDSRLGKRAEHGTNSGLTSSED